MMMPIIEDKTTIANLDLLANLYNKIIPNAIISSVGWLLKYTIIALKFNIFACFLLGIEVPKRQKLEILLTQ